MPPAQRPQSSFPCYSPESSDSALPCPRRSAASSKHDSAPVPDVPLEHRHRRVTASAQGLAARPAPRNNSRLLARRNRGPSPHDSQCWRQIEIAPAFHRRPPCFLPGPCTPGRKKSPNRRHHSTDVHVSVRVTSARQALEDGAPANAATALD